MNNESKSPVADSVDPLLDILSLDELEAVVGGGPVDGDGNSHVGCGGCGTKAN